MIWPLLWGALAGLVVRGLTSEDREPAGDQAPAAEQEMQDAWCARYGRDRRVLAWLCAHPPPEGWQESPAAWAWLNRDAPLDLGEPQIDADAPAAPPAAAPEVEDQARAVELPAVGQGCEEHPDCTAPCEERVIGCEAQLELPALELPELAAELPAAPVRARRRRTKAAAAPVAEDQAPAVEPPAGEKGGSSCRG